MEYITIERKTNNMGEQRMNGINDKHQRIVRRFKVPLYMLYAAVVFGLFHVFGFGSDDKLGVIIISHMGGVVAGYLLSKQN